MASSSSTAAARGCVCARLARVRRCCLVHGWALDLDMWTPQFAALADRYRLIAFDRRGFGIVVGHARHRARRRRYRAAPRQCSASSASRSSACRRARASRCVGRCARRIRTTCLVLDGPPRDLLAVDRPQGEIRLATYRELVRSEGIEAFRQQWLEHPLMRLHTSDAARARLAARDGRPLSGARSA